MTAPITAARTGGASFRVAGIPVTIHVSFLLVIGLLGLGVGGIDRLLVWVGVATLAVLLHELGHGLVGRLAGLQPRIDLAGFGGVTSWSVARAGASRGGLGRGWSLAISLAGPGIGFVGGFVALALGAPCCRIPADADLLGFAAGVWLFASFGWGILNLLPILPLDGGQALREVLPGTPAQRLQRAAIVGAVVGAALASWALANGAAFLALLAGWITWSNIQQIRQARERSGPGMADLAAAQEAARGGDLASTIDRAGAVARSDVPPRVRQAAVALLVRALQATGDHRQAYRVVVDPRRDVVLPTELVGAAIAAHPDHRSVDTVVRGWVARSRDREARGLAAVVLAAHGHHDEVRTLLAAEQDEQERGSEPVVDAPVAVAVQTAAHQDGQYATAAALGWDLVAREGASLRSPVLAYNTACSLARAGRPDDAVHALSIALRLGFADLELLAGDEDLASLHDHPAWPHLRRGEPAPSGR